MGKLHQTATTRTTLLHRTWSFTGIGKHAAGIVGIGPQGGAAIYASLEASLEAFVRRDNHVIVAVAVGDADADTDADAMIIVPSSTLMMGITKRERGGKTKVSNCFKSSNRGV